MKRTIFTEEEQEILELITKKHDVTVWQSHGNLPECVVCVGHKRSIKRLFSSLQEAKTNLL
jgi:malonyl CoA-acyl carrier protein transacylase